MIKKILLFAMFPCIAHGQIGINTPQPTKTLDINGETRVRVLPQGADTDNILSADADGNVRKISRDELTRRSSGFSSTILGYEPQPAANRPQPPVDPAAGSATELGCKVWPHNHHTYCAYQLSRPTNWFNAFSFGKQMGGYLVTMPSDAERIWINTNIVDSGTGFDLANNIWIGANKIARPGNPLQLQWITGEEFRINWSTNPASTENWFDSGEPNGGESEGAVHVISTTSNGQRKWNDFASASTDYRGVPMNQLILEFNE